MSELPPGWAMATLGTVASKIVDGSHNPPAKMATGKPMLSARNIRDEQVVFDDYRLIQEDAFEDEHRRTRIKRGDVLLTIVGAIGRTAVVRDSTLFTLQRSVAVLGDFGEIEPRFLAKSLQSPSYQQWLLENAKGTAQKGVYLKAIASSKVSIAPLPEQRRIVAKIDSLTGKSKRARDHLDHVPRLVEKYKQAVLAAGFGGRLTNLSSDKLPPTTLGELIEIGPQNGLYLPKEKYGSGTPILRIQNYGLNNVDDIATWSRVDVPGATAKQYGLIQGDLVINRVNSPSHLGKSMVVAPEMVGALFESNMMRMRLRRQIEPDFVQLYLSSLEGRARLTKDAKWAVNQASINQGDVTGTVIPLPSHDAQIDILQRISAAFVWIDRLASEATSARRLIDHLDQSVLVKAFRGELVPQNPTDEPANLLLERIRAGRGVTKSGRGRKGKP